MTPEEALRSALVPALACLPQQMDSPEARVAVLAAGLQESRLTARWQRVAGKPRAKGPARGLWQFERGGGVSGVLRHPASRYWAVALCTARACPPKEAAVWLRLETDDVLAAGFARLLVFADRARLPKLEEPDKAWRLYLRTWRPGKPHRATWAECHRQAVKAVLSVLPSAPR